MEKIALIDNLSLHPSSVQIPINPHCVVCEIDGKLQDVYLDV